MAVTITFYGTVNGVTNTMVGALKSIVSSTDNAIVRWDGTDGATTQTSLVTIDDSGAINIPTGQTYKINGTAHTHTATNIGLGNVTNNAQVKKIASATDNAIARWDLTTGDAIQNSGVTVDDSNNVNITTTTSQYQIGGLGVGSFWMLMPTVTRVSATQFTIADSGGTSWQYILTKGICLKWTHSTTHQAMVISSSYATNVTTVNIIGDTLDVGFTATSFYYTNIRAKVASFAIIGNLGVGIDVSGTFYAPYDMKIFGADVRVKTAGTTNSTDFDINDDGTTMFTTKPSIASTATSDVDNTVDDNIIALEDSAITIDIDAVSTTTPIDAYITLYFTPNNNQYLR